MAHIIRRISLDLRKYELLGWEMQKGLLTVSAMREGIRLGHNFPAVDIVEVDEQTYQLLVRGIFACSTNYGGHNRAISHYKEKSPLVCSLWSNHIATPKDFKFKPIRQIKLNGKDKPTQLEQALSHLPREIGKNPYTKYCKYYPPQQSL